MAKGGGPGSKLGGQSEVAPLKRVLLKHPQDAFQSFVVITEEWKRLGYLRQPELGKAINEFDRFVGILESLGARVDFLPPDPETSLDSIYVRDASIVTDGGVILCNMGKEARSGEPMAQRVALESQGIPILGEITGAGRVEGGDFLWLGGGTAVIGRGYRTNDEGIRQLKQLLSETARELIVVPLPHWRGPGDVFHLMSMLSPIDENLALVYSPLLPVPFREHLLARDIKLIEVPDSEFETMGCNVLTVSPRVCVMLEGNPVTRFRLEEAGAKVHLYQGNEISIPGSGGPTCLTLPLLRGA
ncbi:MAG: arginine deiminase family protein [Gemmatimonadota bacterium]|jgi:N-dimethylarginine dimethylaminohydrolase